LCNTSGGRIKNKRKQDNVDGTQGTIVENISELPRHSTVYCVATIQTGPQKVNYSKESSLRRIKTVIKTTFSSFFTMK